ncbi:ABC transporter ATP-binding protein [Jannaschia sp. LMIT008]|uniref:ABC transporter ATP-binding protein n=1 Tax=Jannaschia maritima TaxID=3032585 RepID=UPI002812069E|nr:ABC transporter ATP-binding protein [Jannaschia sp. LMIT008]
MTVLAATDVSGGYARTDAILKGIAIEAAAGEIVAILGPNGAGKSTFLRAVTGQLPHVAGRIALDGTDIAGLRPRRVARAGVGYVPQEANVFATLTVRENLEMGAWLARDPGSRIVDMLDRFPVLAEKRRDAARTLSGGQRQILAMAIALMVEPKLLLLDEPSAGLSPLAAGALFDTIRQVAAQGVAVVLVEQNAMDALSICDRAYILAAGRNHTTGTGAALAADPDIRRTFLGG